MNRKLYKMKICHELDIICAIVRLRPEKKVYFRIRFSKQMDYTFQHNIFHHKYWTKSCRKCVLCYILFHICKGVWFIVWELWWRRSNKWEFIHAFYHQLLNLQKMRRVSKTWYFAYGRDLKSACMSKFLAVDGISVH